MEQKKNIFIGVAWPYVNGILHIGHYAGYLLPADLFAKFHKCLDNNVLMISGSDCFGTPITVEADKKGVTPLEIAETYHEKNVDLFINQLGLSYDLYTLTNNPNHIKITQDFFVRMLEQDLIFKDKTKQFYSVEEKRFLPDRYITGTCPFCGFKDSRSDQCDNCGKVLNQEELIDPKSSVTGGRAELRETEHYFVDWAKLQSFLEKYVGANSNKWKKWVAQETKGWLENKLQPRAITRDLDWGVPLPKDRIPTEKLIDNIDNKRIYVWFDAVIGYLSGSLQWAEEISPNKSGDAWKEFWYDQDLPLEHYYFMGKDNLVFHTLFWPGQLHAYDENLHLPDVVSINMFLDFGGQQFSKSRGVVIEIKEMAAKYGNDALRFYLTYVMPETSDSSFTWESFEEHINNVLVANLGNFIHRTFSIAKDLETPDLRGHEIDKETLDAINTAFINSKEHLSRCEFKKYLDEVLNLSSFGNKLINEKELWKLKDKNEAEFKETISALYAVIISLALLVQPLMPDKARELLTMLGLEDFHVWPQDTDIRTKVQDLKDKAIVVSKPEILFPKISVEDSK